MNKTKVEITKNYCIDLLTTNKQSEEQIIQLAETYLDAQMLAGMEHYYQTGDTDFSVIDVTGTDDLFNPLND